MRGEKGEDERKERMRGGEKGEGEEERKERMRGKRKERRRGGERRG